MCKQLPSVFFCFRSPLELRILSIPWIYYWKAHVKPFQWAILATSGPRIQRHGSILFYRRTHSVSPRGTPYPLRSKRWAARPPNILSRPQPPEESQLGHLGADPRRPTRHLLPPGNLYSLSLSLWAPGPLYELQPTRVLYHSRLYLYAKKTLDPEKSRSRLSLFIALSSQSATPLYYFWLLRCPHPLS